MTVADNTSRNQYTATSGQTVFAYTFEIVDKGDIVVLKNGTTLSEGTNYTVSNVGNDSGGNVTLTVGATTGDVLTLYRDMPYSRTQNYTNSGDFLASEVNSDFDNLWLAGEQTNRSFSQSIRKPITDSDSISMELPAAATRVNSFLTFDSTGAVSVESLSSANAPSNVGRQQFTGNGSTTVFALAAEAGSGAGVFIYIDGVYQESDTYTISGKTLTFTEAPPINASIEVVSYRTGDINTADANAVTYTPAGTGAVQTTVQTKLRESVSVKDFGAVGDGVTDDTAAIQAAVTSGASNIHFPNGTYICAATFTSVDDVKLHIDAGATLKTNSSDPIFTLTTCERFNIDGGYYTSDSRVSAYILLSGSAFCTLTNIRAGFGTKSTYSVGIIYTTGAIKLDNSDFCTIRDSDLYNMEGAGLLLLNGSTNNLIEANYIHDNITGILNNGDSSSFNSFIGNKIGFNNVNSQSGADGILVNATDIDNASSGHIVSNNTIYNSGEHGMYFQASNSVINSNACYDNAGAGIKAGKVRGVTISNNTCHSNSSSGIQFQSGFENLIISGNTLRLNSPFDIDCTYDTGIDPFGGEDVLIEGNYCFSTGNTYSIDASCENNLQIKDNFCALGVILTFIGTQADVNICNNTIQGLLATFRTSDAMITNNRIGNLTVNNQTTGLILRGNIIDDLNLSSRKDVPLYCFAEISNNKIYSSVVSGAPIYELFNAQDTDTSDLMFTDNFIETAGALVINKSGTGINFDDSIISNNRFKVAGGNPSIQIDSYLGANTNLVITGNSGVVGTNIELTNSVAVGNTGGATFTNDGGSQIANNV